MVGTPYRPPVTRQPPATGQPAAGQGQDDQDPDSRDNRFGGKSGSQIMGFFAMIMSLLGMGDMFGGGDGGEDGPGGGIMSWLMSMFKGGSDGQQQNTDDPSVVSANRDARAIDTHAAGESPHIQKEAAVSALTDISSISFKHPGTNEPQDLAKVAEDLSAMPGIRLYNDKTKQYESFSGDAQALKQAIANDSSGLVEVQVGASGGQPQVMNFKQVDQAARGESDNGFTAASWTRTDATGQQSLSQDGNALAAGKNDLWLTYPGYGDDFTKVAESQDGQSRTLRGIAEGGVSQQTPDAVRFAGRSIKDVGGEEHLNAVVAGDHSMGVANAHAARKFLEAKNIPVQEFSFESAADSLEAQKVMAAIRQPDSALHQEMVKQGASDAQIAKVSDDFASNSSGLRDEVETNGTRRLSDVANLDVGIGLMQGYMQFQSKKSSGELDTPGSGNSMTAGRQEFLNVTGENLADAGIDTHRLRTIYNALVNNQDEIRVAGQALSDSNVTAAKQSETTPPTTVVASNAAKQQGQEQGRGG